MRESFFDDSRFDNDAIVPVPAMYADDEPLTIYIKQSGVEPEGGARFAYRVMAGDVIGVQGDDLRGPAHGVWPEAHDMARVLAGFLGATYECGDLTEHGEQYSRAEQEWLSVHAERLSMWNA